jgi:AcrR family transcriptional regulator
MPEEPSGRDRLLQQTIAYVSRQGVADLTLRTLAGALGTSHRMLIYHFGSKEGLLAAVVAELERGHRELLAELMADPDMTVPALARQLWRRVSAPEMWPFARLFFEVYAHGTQGRAHARPLLDAALEPWFDAVTELHRRQGLSPARARAHAHQGIAVTRGLLLDLIATGNRRDVDRAMKLQIEMYEQDLERHGTHAAVDGGSHR